MTHTELIPDVWIIDRKVRHDQIRHQQLLEHVCTNVPCAHLLICAENLEAHNFKSRLDKVAINPIKINLLFDAEGHRYERVVCHNSLPLLRPVLFSSNELYRSATSIVLHLEMNLVAGDPAHIVICTFCTHPLHRFMEPDVERNLVAI